MTKHSLTLRRISAGLLGGALFFGVGCKKHDASNQPPPAPEEVQPAPRSDGEIAGDVEARLKAETALNADAIQVNAAGGAVTLSGSVDNEAARALAANDAASVNGVKTVINNLVVNPAKPAPQAATTPEPRERSRRRERDRAEENATASYAANQPATQQPGQNAPAEAALAAAPATPAPPPPPPQPVVRTVTIPSGATIPVRLTDALDSASAQAGQTFGGSVASDVIFDGMVAIPRGSVVTGRVVNVQDAAHFKGNAMLSLELISVRVNGQPISLVTSPYVQQGQARGKNTAEKTGGGAALGAIIGALAGGGKGAAIGAIAGGGAGAGVNAVTRGQQVKLSPETLINFQLQSPVTVRTSHANNGADGDEQGSGAPQLQPR